MRSAGWPRRQALTIGLWWVGDAELTRPRWGRELPRPHSALPPVSTGRADPRPHPGTVSSRPTTRRSRGSGRSASRRGTATGAASSTRWLLATSTAASSSPAWRGSGLERLARHILRPPVSLERMCWDAAADNVAYKLKPKSGQPRGEEQLDPLDFLARLLVHVPEPRPHCIHYSGRYSNAARGRRAKGHAAQLETRVGTAHTDHEANRLAPAQRTAETSRLGAAIRRCCSTPCSCRGWSDGAGTRGVAPIPIAMRTARARVGSRLANPAPRSRPPGLSNPPLHVTRAPSREHPQPPWYPRFPLLPGNPPPQPRHHRRSWAWHTRALSTSPICTMTGCPSPDRSPRCDR